MPLVELGQPIEESAKPRPFALDGRAAAPGQRQDRKERGRERQRKDEQSCDSKRGEAAEASNGRNAIRRERGEADERGECGDDHRRTDVPQDPYDDFSAGTALLSFVVVRGYDVRCVDAADRQEQGRQQESDDVDRHVEKPHQTDHPDDPDADRDERHDDAANAAETDEEHERDRQRGNGNEDVHVPRHDSGGGDAERRGTDEMQLFRPLLVRENRLHALDDPGLDELVIRHGAVGDDEHRRSAVTRDERTKERVVTDERRHVLRPAVCGRNRVAELEAPVDAGTDDFEARQALDAFDAGNRGEAGIEATDLVERRRPIDVVGHDDDGVDLLLAEEIADLVVIDCLGVAPLDQALRRAVEDHPAREVQCRSRAGENRREDPPGVSRDHAHQSRTNASHHPRSPCLITRRRGARLRRATLRRGAR